MLHDKMPVTVLSTQIIPNADTALRRALKLNEEERSLAIITCDCDDMAYVALDEATKKAQVRVAYAHSFYAGSGNASTALSGEWIGILAAENPEQARSGLIAAVEFLNSGAGFCSANQEDTVVYFAHCISRSGSYLSKEANVREGASLAYLIAPPTEAMVGLDAALKAAQTELQLFYGPPTETNFAGGILTGEQAACKAACEAFAQAVCDVAARPLQE